MKYYLAKENFRLVDKGKYYSVHEVLELEEEYVSSSRSLAAASKTNWVVKITAEEAKKRKKELERSKIVKAKVEKEESKKGADLVVKDMKPSAIADEVLDQRKITEIVEKRKEDRQKAEIDYQKSLDKTEAKDAKTKDVKPKENIKETIKKRAEKIKSTKKKLKIGDKKKTTKKA